MKKRAVILCLVCSFVLCIALPFGQKSYADPFTASQLASASYALFNGWGIAFNTSNATAAGMNSFMTSQIESYVNSRGGSIADVFVGQMAVDAAGKLVVGYELYNSFIGFKDWITDKFGLGTGDSNIGDIAIDGQGNLIPIENGRNTESGIKSTGFSCVMGQPGQDSPKGTFYCNGQSVAFYTQSSSVSWGSTVSWTVYYADNQWKAELYGKDTWGSDGLYRKGYLSGTALYGPPQSLDWNGSSYSAPTVLNPDKQWTGTIGGYSTPDTNLDQLLGNIDQAVADNNLVVDGETTDVPVPPGPVPTWTPVDDVIDGINGLGEELDGIGQDIGDISGHLDDIGDQIDGIGDQIGDVTGALEGVQEGIQTQTGVISGAMDQAVQDVADAIGSQTAALDESLTATAEGIQDITDILTAPEVDTPKFDLRELFPFCIPFDIYHLLQKFDGTPAAPHVQLPIVIPSIGFSYTLDLDFSSWDPVAAAMRTVELIVYALGLAWATSKAIKW